MNEVLTDFDSDSSFKGDNDSNSNFDSSFQVFLQLFQP